MLKCIRQSCAQISLIDMWFVEISFILLRIPTYVYAFFADISVIGKVFTVAYVVWAVAHYQSCATISRTKHQAAHTLLIVA